jgi:septum site-determining protein MinD
MSGALSMAKVLVVTSGKGGVGKTTSTAALGAALALNGKKVVVVDFDVGLRNLDLVMGAERRVVFDLINVAQGEAKLSQALIRDKRIESLHLLPASQTRDKDALNEKGLARVMKELRSQFDWVICDSPAGIERGAILAMRHADAAVIVTNPEVSSVRDSDRIIGLLDSKTERAEKGNRVEKHLLITRFDKTRASRGEMLQIDDVLDILSIDLLGIIPESEQVLRASNLGQPVTLASPLSAPARAYGDAARRLMGDQVAMNVPLERFSLLNRRRETEPATAPIARERLQVLLEHERTSPNQPNLLTVLKDEIINAIARHVSVKPEAIKVRIERRKSTATMRIAVDIPK